MIQSYVLLRFFLFFMMMYFPSDALIAGGNHVCTRATSYTYKCGRRLRRRRRCTGYSTAYICCSGYYSKDNVHCNFAICDSKVDPDACHKTFSHYIKYRNGHQENNSGGNCVSPEVCGNCRDGFYSAGPYCEMCPVIINCNHQRCTNRNDVGCVYCDGEVKDKVGWRAYTRHQSGFKACQKTCSWRDDSRRCYPGTCASELVGSCKCSTGFTGTHCETILEDPVVLLNELKLYNNMSRVTSPEDPNKTDRKITEWTNKNSYTDIKMSFTAKSVFNGTLPAPPEYVTDFQYGIIIGEMTARFTRVYTIKVFTPHPCDKVPAFSNTSLSMDTFKSKYKEWDSINNISNSSQNESALFCVGAKYHMLCLCPYNVSLLNSSVAITPLDSDCSCPSKSKSTLKYLDCSCTDKNEPTPGNTSCLCLFEIPTDPPVLPYDKTIVEEYDIHKTCTSASESSPKAVNYRCENDQDLSHWPLPFKHNDTVILTLTTKNGGIIDYVDRDNNIPKRASLIGRLFTNQLTVWFDFVQPRHCHLDENPALPCDNDTLSIPDLTTEQNVTFEWQGWYDDLAGIKSYHYEIYDLQFDGDNLVERTKVFSSDQIDSNVSKDSFIFPYPGMFAIHFTAFDKGENYRTMRRLTLFDDKSVVSIQPNASAYVSTASPSTNFTWITSFTSHIDVTWVDRYINVRHHRHHWLDSVASHTGIQAELDDNEGSRSINQTSNVRGIVRFEVATHVELYTGDIYGNFSITSNLYKEGETLNITLDDGDRLYIYVRAYDVLGAFWEDKIHVTEDTSPPIITDLWLTRGDRLNISVHSLTELTQMTVEWLAYDYHSGVHSVQWRLYDNYTGVEVLHGTDWMVAQGNTKNNSECEKKYDQYTRGANCYCTRYNGCYHKHFHNTLRLVDDITQGGILAGKDVTTHDYDLIFEVTVTNNALVNTTQELKISIDTSPPHTGTVQEGRLGEKEMDHQQEKEIHFHWSGFFDKESGVLFYHYAVHHTCIPMSAFSIHGYNNSSEYTILETYGTSGSVKVSTEGTYHVTVVAYNRALDSSGPVCSDGVTIDTSLPSVSEVLIRGSRIRQKVVLDDNGKVWLINPNRTVNYIQNASAKCRNIATPVQNFALYPINRYEDGRVVTAADTSCVLDTFVSAPITTVLQKSTNLEISWESIVTPSGIHDFEVGLSSVENSSSPDILPLQSTYHHNFIKIHHPNVPEGTIFFIIIKSISKAGVTKIQTVGPVIVDNTPPTVQGNIRLSLHNGVMTADWSRDTFMDTEEPYFLDYQYAVGSYELGSDVQDYMPLQKGDRCGISGTPNCTAIVLDASHWMLHEHLEYFVSIKVGNTAGLVAFVTSNPLIFDNELATAGVVYDLSLGFLKSSTEWRELQDIDFQTNNSVLYAKWTGFSHPHLNITYKIGVGTTQTSNDVVEYLYVADQTEFLITGLNLTQLQKYYVTVVAVTSTGEVSAVSDGVTIVSPGMVLHDIQILDGRECSAKNNTAMKKTHHNQDLLSFCENDTDFQTSVNSMECYWQIPPKYTHLITSVFWAIEKRSPTVRYWWDFRNFKLADTMNSTSDHSLVLEPGGIYRAVVKFCAEDICFKTLHSDGISIVPNPPITGNVIVDTDANGTVRVVAERFSDPDLEKHEESLEAVDFYEWAINDGWNNHALLTTWMSLDNKNGTHLMINISSFDEFPTTPCKSVTVRGYNKAGVHSSVSADLRGCTKPSADYVRFYKVLDVLGEPLVNAEDANNNKGRGIKLDTNEAWPTLDHDYTGYNNILSAVWPRLRHHNYTWAVLEVSSMDTLKLYSDDTIKEIQDLCSHPYALRCNDTDLNYVNVFFDDGELEHGKRYVICVHGNQTLKENEFWTMEVQNLTSCSDGITVDLTPPTSGNVYIGQTPNTRFQTSTTSITVNWDSFLDVEEYKLSSHAFGIQRYMLAIGTHRGGNDVSDFTDVGVINHKTLHGLNLQSGHKYYATIKAFDFTNKFTTVTSEPVVVDTSPPNDNNVTITVGGRHITSSKIYPCWRGLFLDRDSGIVSYSWAVGSSPGARDILDLTETGKECTSSPENLPLKLKNGHAYFITVYARNGAGLVSSATSLGYIVDTTPPTAGQVYDGRSPRGDIDYQYDLSRVACQWKGFHDPHTVIHDYFIGVGTCSRCDDVIEMHSVGTDKDMEFLYIPLKPGRKYFCIVRACNTANLCTAAASDGFIVDNSPPTVGRVIDGTGENDEEFQYHRNMISAKWFGFVDPHSGLSHYSVRGGSVPGGDNVLKTINVHLTEESVMPKLSRELPVGTLIYVTIRAYNKAGLYSEATSNGFMVDDSAPEFLSGPSLSHKSGSIIQGTLVYRSSMKVTWGVVDEQSFIERQYISLESHIGSEFNVSSIQLNGIVREYILTDLSLHDGNQYFVKVISCNGAKVCTRSVSNPISVDSSPPTRGFFAIDTEHAVNAELARNVSGWMTWSEVTLRLAWLGFSDIHSGINSYLISVGSSYMANDLLKVTKDQASATHDSNSKYKNKEDAIQLYSVHTKSLSLYRTVFVSLSAVNGVGLRSAVIHSQFRLLEGGSLELIRRCTSTSCTGHCVCSAQDTSCHSGSPCRDITNNVRGDITVTDIQDLRFIDNGPDIDYIFTDMTLAAYWNKVQRVLWYEWSVGYTHNNEPHGIFDVSTERTWHDCGHSSNIVYTLSQGKKLRPDIKYSVFIRAWYSTSQYGIFKSDGVVAMTKSPAVSSKTGSKISERFWKSKKSDIDFVSDTKDLYINWSNVFINGLKQVKFYDVYISTYPGGFNVYRKTRESVYIEHHNITQIITRHAVKYYCNVVAYGLSGMSTTMTSDGFVIDAEKPKIGIVQDGIDMYDASYQNSSSLIAARWLGFTDHVDGIQNYVWCVGKTDNDNDCSVKNSLSVGLRTSFSSKLLQPLQNGLTIYNRIYAMDSVGHRSEIAVSDGVTIDTTPPVASAKLHFGDNIVLNPSFDESNGLFLSHNDLHSQDTCTFSSLHHPKHWSVRGCAVTVSASSIFEANKYVVFSGSLSQILNNLSINEEYKLKFKTTTVKYTKTANREGRLSISGKSWIFLLTNIKSHVNNHQEITSWQMYTFYFLATTTTDTLTIESVGDRGGFAIDDVHIQKVRDGGQNISYHTEVKVQMLEDQHFVFAKWSIEDTESPIVNYKWAIGTVPGGTTLQPFRSVGTQRHGQNNDLTLEHNSTLYVTVIATNAAELQSTFYSSQVLIDYTPPIVKVINDGKGEDIDIQDHGLLSVNWLFEDEESGLKACFWGIGLSPNTDDIQSFREIQFSEGTGSIYHDISLIDGKTLFSTIRCENNVGQNTTAVTDGVLVTTTGPTGGAVLTIQELSVTEFEAVDGHQSVTNSFKSRWTAFEEKNILYEVYLSGPALSYRQVISSEEPNIVRFVAKGFNMHQGVHNVTLIAINSLGMRSNKLTSQFKVMTQSTERCNDNFKVVVDPQDTAILTVSWQNVFPEVDSSVHFYEVSAGTELGGANIFQWQETKKDNIKIVISRTVETNTKIYIVVRAIFQEGFYQICTNDYAYL